jgi:predicted SAM-dependent methyltransferase
VSIGSALGAGLRWGIDRTSSAAGRLRRGKRVRPPSGVVKVNLGCGLAVAPGWINVDGSLNALLAGWPRPVHRLVYRVSGSNRYYPLDEYCRLLEHHVWVHYDLAYGIPFPDNSIDYLYSSHFLEHLEEEEAAGLLAESHRVLKPGGFTRICVPDLAHAIALYHEGKKEQMLRSYFFVEPELGYFARHKYMYDFETLGARLERAGFRDIRRCDYRIGAVPDLDILDNRAGETLFVEAVKP